MHYWMPILEAALLLLPDPDIYLAFGCDTDKSAKAKALAAQTERGPPTDYFR